MTEPGASHDRPGDPVVRRHLRELYDRHAGAWDDGVVRFYPPEAESRRHLFGVAAAQVDGTLGSLGDCDVRFPLHSISKVFTHALALEDNGRDRTLRRVGVEPSGEAYNSIIFDEVNNRPHNPMKNAGALVATNLVRGRDGEEKVRRLLERLRVYTGNPDLDIDRVVLDEQLVSNDRNLALSYLMRSLGMLEGDIEENIVVYLSVCSVTVTTTELALMGATLANGGSNPVTGARALPREYVRDVVSVMATCGMYDAVGQWIYDVGLPAKSGVSGGIMATVPSRIGLAVYSPGLDAHGNSVRGVNVCRDLSARFGLHMFNAPEDIHFGAAPPRSDPTTESSG